MFHIYEETLSKLNLERLKPRRIRLIFYCIIRFIGPNGLININTEGSRPIRPFNNHRGHNKNLYQFL